MNFSIDENLLSSTLPVIAAKRKYSPVPNYRRWDLRAGVGCDLKRERVFLSQTLIKRKLIK